MEENKETITLQEVPTETIVKVDTTSEVVEEKPEIKQQSAKELARTQKAIQFEDGTIISNLKVTYKNLFDFQNSYSGAKDLMEALIKKQTFEHEVMIQMMYVGYLGTNPNPKMEYMDFIDRLSFDYERDMYLFNALVKRNNEKN